VVKIDFEMTHSTYGVYRDALYLPEGHGLSDEEIKAMQQERFDNWVKVIETPAPAEEVAPVVEENPDDYIEINGVKYKKVPE
jgi:hypothetical protein